MLFTYFLMYCGGRSYHGSGLVEIVSQFILTQVVLVFDNDVRFTLSEKYVCLVSFNLIIIWLCGH